MDVTVYAHTHWDREWYRSFEEFRLRLIEVIDNVIFQLENNKASNFFLDGQTIVLDDYFALHPQNKEKIKQLINDNKLFIGPWYVLADEFLVSGECLIRNLYYGIKNARTLGVDKFIGYLPDSFGHNSQIPQILNSFNIKDCVLWRGAGNKPSEFIWQSLDGSQVFTVHLIHGYFQDILNQNISLEEKAQKLKQILDKIKQNSLTEYILLPSGGDHINLPDEFENLIIKINNKIEEYNINTGSLLSYIDKVKLNIPNLIQYTGELNDNSTAPILPSTYSTRIHLKKLNIISTFNITKLLEPLISILNTQKLIPDYNKELEYLWKLLLKNQPHDSICGCSIDSVHREMETRFERIDGIFNYIMDKSMLIASKLANYNKLIIFNHLNNKYTGPVKVKVPYHLLENSCILINITCDFPENIMFDTQRAPLKEDIKPFYEYLVWVKDLDAISLNYIDVNHLTLPQDIPQISLNHIENSKVKIKINDKTGFLILLDKETNKVFDNLHVFCDYADNGDTYNFDPIEGDTPINAEFITSKIIESNNIRAILKIEYQIKIPEYLTKDNKRSSNLIDHDIDVFITVQAESKRIDFKTVWENKSKNHLLQLKFAFEEPVNKTISENTLGLIERSFDPNYRLEDNPPAKQFEELKTNTAPMQRFVWCNGLGIITKGLQEYKAENNNLYITLLRSVGMLSKEKLRSRNLCAGPPLTVNQAQCLNEQTNEYALYPTDSPSELFSRTDAFYSLPIARYGLLYKRENKVNCINLVNYDNPNIYTYCIKPSQVDGFNGIIVRLFNLSNQTQNIRFKACDKFTMYIQTNSYEEKNSKECQIDSELEFKPYELKTIIFILPQK